MTVIGSIVGLLFTLWLGWFILRFVLGAAATGARGVSKVRHARYIARSGGIPLSPEMREILAKSEAERKARFAQRDEP